MLQIVPNYNIEINTSTCSQILSSNVQGTKFKIAIAKKHEGSGRLTHR